MANASEEGGKPHVEVAGSPKLLDRVREKIRYLHYSYRTEQAYVMWMRRFIYFHGKRHPREMGAPEIEAFLTDLVEHITCHRRLTR